MPSLWSMLWSSVCKKTLNAVSGLALCGFIVVHLVGNITLLTGKAEAFNSYAHFLLSTGALIYVAEGGLLLFFLLHILTGTMVWWDKQMARPQSYEKSSAAGDPSKKTIASSTMIYTGVTILTFSVLHLLTFKYGPGMGEGYTVQIGGETIRDLYRLSIDVFQRPGYTIWYIIAMIILGTHLRHGFWSAFQSLGLNHPRYTPIIYGIALIFGVFMAFGFLVIPAIIFFRGGAL